MTEKEKIRAEIKRLCEENKERHSIEGIAAVTELRKLLSVIDSMQEESASGDLEKAVELYADNMEVSAGCGTEFTTEELKDAIMFGANYQKQQLMKDAVDTKIISDGCFPIIKYQLPLTYDCKIGDRVKLIIVKEE